MSFEYFAADSHVSTYNKFRPSPPKSLIDRIVEFTLEKIPEPLELAIDVGCGSGQSTEVLAPYFKKVLGLDSNPKIINKAKEKCQNSNVFYSTSSAEKMDVKDKTAHLITVGQALHWLDINKFYSEAERILSYNGVLAVYGYHLPELIYNDNKKIATLVKKYYTEILGDYTLPQSRKVYLENYSTPEFNEIYFIEGGTMKREDDFIVETEGVISDVIGYITSWSAFQNYTNQMGEKNGQKILEKFNDEFKACLECEKNLEAKFKIKFKYFLLLGRKG